MSVRQKSFFLTEKEKKNMEDYIKANIVDSQIGRHKKKPDQEQAF